MFSSTSSSARLMDQIITHALRQRGLPYHIGRTN